MAQNDVADRNRRRFGGLLRRLGSRLGLLGIEACFPKELLVERLVTTPKEPH